MDDVNEENEGQYIEMVSQFDVCKILIGKRTK